MRLALLALAAGLLVVAGCGSEDDGAPDPGSGAGSTTTSNFGGAGAGSGGDGGALASTAQIEQYGIVWQFQGAVPFGQFANGDYWVLAPVTVTAVTPDFDGSLHGLERDPVYEGGQGIDGRIENFDASLVPELPLTIEGDASLVKGMSNAEGPCATFDFQCLTTASVLTVLAARPADDGARSFRPPFVGTDKPLYSVDDLRLADLPSLPRLGEARSLAWVERRFARPQIDYKYGRMGRSLRPIDNYRADATDDDSRYGSVVGDDNAEAALALLLDDPIEQKMPALIRYVQAGIDGLYEARLGRSWTGAGAGIEPAFKVPLAFAAALLGDADLESQISEARGFSEYHYMKPSAPNPSRALYGTQNQYWGEREYWQYLVDTDAGLDPSSSAMRDPYFFIDGETPQRTYQFCCFAQPWKGSILAAHLFPAMLAVWNNDLILEYVDRWATVGTWTQPDPCAPHDGDMGNYGITFGPDSANPGMCILDTDLAYYNDPTDFACQPGAECGRYPERHGLYTDGGYYRRDSIDALWSAYR
ncbi:MAG: hypothetical protein JRI23_13705 [Deltaproteobacteria bacterium]|jgi:hypothetical protein|nr:hypothetical protein [Deltaproteobacteria bacterium]MBW2532784.1 hypothetical protein [Deltaproteobacteria bacterium]